MLHLATVHQKIRVFMTSDNFFRIFQSKPPGNQWSWCRRRPARPVLASGQNLALAILQIGDFRVFVATVHQEIQVFVTYDNFFRIFQSKPPGKQWLWCRRRPAIPVLASGQNSAIWELRNGGFLTVFSRF